MDTDYDSTDMTAVRTVSLTHYLLPRIHPDGWRFIAFFALCSTLCALWWWPLTIPGLALTVWCLYFFRDPPRITPSRTGLLISPADGVVQTILMAPPPPELGMGHDSRVRVSVFMSLFNCHVNRVPADGMVLQTAYRPGRFVNASFDKASEGNERLAVRLALPDGRDLAFVQIAGLVARRIRCDLQEGMTVQAGERFGLIRFGSRVDVYLPEGVTSLVSVGQPTMAGETVIADLAYLPLSPMTRE